jgi:hypothetical protein
VNGREDIAGLELDQLHLTVKLASYPRLATSQIAPLLLTMSTVSFLHVHACQFTNLNQLLQDMPFAKYLRRTALMKIEKVDW